MPACGWVCPGSARRAAVASNCADPHENLCDFAAFTGYGINGGYAENICTAHCTPSLSAGPQRGRSLARTADVCGAHRLPGAEARGVSGLIPMDGFGAAAHLWSRWQSSYSRQLDAFTRPGDEAAKGLARSLGCTWAGDSGSAAAGGIGRRHNLCSRRGPCSPRTQVGAQGWYRGLRAFFLMNDIPSFSYDLLGGERSIRRAANLTRGDAEEFLELARRIPVIPTTTSFPLAEANTAIDRLRAGAVAGAAVLIPLTSALNH